jgi:hypothetical protein
MLACRGGWRRLVLVVAVALPLASAAMLAATWDPFPGAWANNRPAQGGDKLERAETRKRELLARLGLAVLPRPLSIRVGKSARRLWLSGGGRELFTCRVGLGGAPVGPKLRRGDNRTPEGEYFVCTRNAHSQFHLFLGLRYPNEADAGRGRDSRYITPDAHRRIVAAVRSGRQPPWDTSLGGTVGIHGSGSGWDWTLGCIALDDGDIETLWALCPIGTPVRIEP